MQAKDKVTRVAGALNHPSAAEWMGYLYDEIAPERKGELHAHIVQCAVCREQLNQWRAGCVALDDWKLPVLHRARPRWQPAIVSKCVAAAVMVLAVGFAIGRQSSGAAGELAALKVSVTQLTQQMVRERGFAASNSVAAASAVANKETFRWLSAYAMLDEERRAEGRRTVAVALREMDARLINLRTELETVAINTATGFRQTKEGLTTLASYTVPDHGDASDFPKPEIDNH